jgi:N-acetylmuramoyl-L-alanine amidase
MVLDLGMALDLIHRPSPNFDARDRPVELVVLHYTGMQTGEVALARLTDPAPVAGRYPGPWQGADIDPAAPLGRVSCHYVVAEDGRVFRLVAEEDRAWHAGQSNWLGEPEVNSRSIGIEIVNGGHDFGLPDFPPLQIQAVVDLVGDIIARRKLPPKAVVGHSDIAPGRKLDPGEKFPWRALAAAGVSIWPGGSSASSSVALAAGATGASVAALQQSLATIGYAIEPSGAYDEATRIVLSAFQRRFRPERVDGVADVETSALVQQVALDYYMS